MRDIIRVEKIRRKDASWRPIYIVKCATCDNELRIRSNALNTDTQLRCLKCQNRKRPYESAYNSFVHGAEYAGHKVSVTYEEYLEYMAINRCEYCGKEIERNPYPVVNGKYSTRAPSLDRKDSSKDYSKDNIAVCCFDCNRAKSNIFSYETWKEMTKSLRRGYTEPVPFQDQNRYYVQFGHVIAAGNE